MRIVAGEAFCAQQLFCEGKAWYIEGDIGLKIRLKPQLLQPMSEFLTDDGETKDYDKPEHFVQITLDADGNAKSNRATVKVEG